MNDIYEDIVNVGNNFDSLKIKLEDRTTDINSNLGVSAMQPIPMPVVSILACRHFFFASKQQWLIIILCLKKYVVEPFERSWLIVKGEIGDQSDSAFHD